MKKLSMLIVEASDQDQESGIYCHVELKRDESLLKLVLTPQRYGVAISGNMLISSQSELDQLAKAVAVSWKVHDEKRRQIEKLYLGASEQ